jgi:rhamnose utilization protein RhaD (predicted bifunctional aldolase and dehydrogenase)
MGTAARASLSQFDDLLTLSHFAGADLLLTQGGGGNTSVKSADGRQMWVKASGLRLADLRQGFGYVETDLPALLRLLRDPGLRRLPAADGHAAGVRGVQAAVAGSETRRASLETLFHAALDTLVLHTHPVYVNAFACLVEGEAELRAATAHDSPWAWVPYATPGYALSMAVAEAVGFEAGPGDSPPRPHSVVLANHGLIVHGEAASTLMDLTQRMVELGQRRFGPLPRGALEESAPPDGARAWAGRLRAALVAQGRIAANAVARPARFRLLQAAATPESWVCAGPLVPDDVVYTGRQVWFAASRQPPEELAAALAGGEGLGGRVAAAVEGQGVMLAGPSEGFVAAMEENLLAHLLVRRLIAQGGGTARHLPGWAIEALCDMESERYRQAVAANGLAGG